MSDELNVWLDVNMAAYNQGYAQAVADVVEWLEGQHNGRLQSPVFLADQITQRFGKDA